MQLNIDIEESANEYWFVENELILCREANVGNPGGLVRAIQQADSLSEAKRMVALWEYGELPENQIAWRKKENEKIERWNSKFGDGVPLY